MHSPQGRLALASYPNERIRSALHRLNAEELDVTRQVMFSDVIVEMTALRERGWLIEQNDDGTGCVAVMLPVQRGCDRLVISVQARAGVIAERGEEFLQLLLQQRDRIAALYEEEQDVGEASNVSHLATPLPVSHHRQWA